MLNGMLYNSLISSKFPCGKLKTYIGLFLKEMMMVIRVFIEYAWEVGHFRWQWDIDQVGEFVLDTAIFNK